MPRGGSRRTYVRDANGRFASTPGGGTPKRPPAKRVSRGTNRLTRDNSGRIAGVGKNGATARGGRLRTAAGNLRARQTDRLKGAPKGVVSRAGKGRGIKAKSAPRTPATSRLKPGELMNAVARPVNTMAKPKKGENPFQNANSVPISERRKVTLANVKVAKNWLESNGIQVRVYSGSPNGAYARAYLGTAKAEINRNSMGWQDPKSTKLKERRSGFKSTSSPLHTLFHEMGHTRDTVGSVRRGMARTREETWLTPNLTLDPWARRVRGQEVARLARRVSRYATTNPAEFIAETYAGLKTGRRYDFQVMRAYREAMGLSSNPAARRRSRVRRPKP